MLITKINIPEDEKKGLARINMPRTEKLVLIAGANGSGKSRILDKIKNTLLEKPTIADIEREISDKKRYENEIRTQEETLILMHEQNKGVGGGKYSDEEIQRVKNIIESLNSLIEKNTKSLKWNLIETSEVKEFYDYVDFVPKNLDLTDSRSHNRYRLIESVKKLDQVGVANSSESTFAKIQHVQDLWFNATHPSSSVNENNKFKYIADYERLCDYVNTFLGAKLDRTGDGDATIFGRVLGESGLSDGQKVLLQLCLALYTQQSKLNDFIIFMDEPENHLHPKALIEVVDKLFSTLANGQLWIATHSINLLAHYDPKHIWYVENGEISFSGNIPERVLEGLIGNQDEIDKLSNFLSLPAQMATAKFSFECLMSPKAIVTGVGDPQTTQIINAINSLKNKGDRLRILDFGAGKGRLLSTIFDTTASTEVNVSEWLDYYAYDLPSEDKAECLKVLERVYGSDKTRYFDDEEKFKGALEEHTFDMIIMCNVFHEIDPKGWLDLFREGGLIRSTLSEEGTLLIVEDQLIPVGEKAYKNGFLVFDKPQFKKLFGIKADYREDDFKQDGRLKAHFIPANVLKNISNASRVEAIKSLREAAKIKIKKLRSEDASFKNGKLHGFWIQQVANAQLCLDEFE